MPIAVIDIGSNTINLLIAEITEEGFDRLHFERIPAKLAKGGMKDNRLTDEAMERGFQALKRHRVACEIAQVQRLKITATSAVRSASNGQEFVDRIKRELDLDIEVIDGNREAELICKGVNLTGLLDDGPALIMDIGGGSTEFILADEEEIFWMKSYDLGVTRLMERFAASDPFTESQEGMMNEALTTDMSELWEVLERFPVKRMIGASGSFNSINLMLAKGDIDKVDPVYDEIDLTLYSELSHTLRRSNSEVRKEIVGLVADRVETIPYSALMIDLVLKHAEINTIHRTTFALKEGVLSEMI